MRTIDILYNVDKMCVCVCVLFWTHKISINFRVCAALVGSWWCYRPPWLRLFWCCCRSHVFVCAIILHKCLMSEFSRWSLSLLLCKSRPSVEFTWHLSFYSQKHLPFPFDSFFSFISIATVDLKSSNKIADLQFQWNSIYSDYISLYPY